MPSRPAARRSVAVGGGAALAAALVLPALAGCVAPPPRATAEIQALRVEALPAGPEDPVWRRAPIHTASLIPQDLVEPRLLQPSTSRVDVQALTDGGRLAVRLAWADGSRDDLAAPARFVDGCAIQIPKAAQPDVPDPQMGQSGRPVEITYWRASWEAWAAGRPDGIRSIHPAAVVGPYPFDAPPLQAGSEEQLRFETRYSPAEATGNRREGPRQRTVEDLVAEGPGTLRPAAEQRSEGHGRRTGAGWEVMIVRPLPGDLAAGGRTQIAFAVWEGGHGEAGSRKMRSGWVPLLLSEGEAPR